MTTSPSEQTRIPVMGATGTTRRWLDADGAVVAQEQVCVNYAAPSPIPCYRDPLTHETMMEENEPKPD